MPGASGLISRYRQVASFRDITGTRTAHSVVRRNAGDTAWEWSPVPSLLGGNLFFGTQWIEFANGSNNFAIIDGNDESAVFSVDIDGNVAAAGAFYGSGIGLTLIPSAQLAGTLPAAVFPTPTTIDAAAGTIAISGLLDKGGQFHNAKSFGAKGDGKRVRDAAMSTASPNTFNSNTAYLSAVDVGKLLLVEGAGPGGADLVTTIAAVLGNFQATTTDPCQTTVTGSEAVWGTDDTAAVQNAAAEQASTYNAEIQGIFGPSKNGSVVFFPSGLYLFRSTSLGDASSHVSINARHHITFAGVGAGTVLLPLTRDKRLFGITGGSKAGRFENLVIDRIPGATVGGNGVEFHDWFACEDWSFANVTVRNQWTGVLAASCRLTAASFDPACRFYDNVHAGVDLPMNNDVVFNGGFVYRNGVYGVKVGDPTLAVDSDGAVICHGTEFYENGVWNLYAVAHPDHPIQNLIVTGGICDKGGETGGGIYVENAVNVQIDTRTSWSDGEGIKLRKCSDVNLAGQITDCNESGLIIDTCSNVSAPGFMVIGSGRSALTTTYGVKVLGATRNVNLRGAIIGVGDDFEFLAPPDDDRTFTDNGVLIDATAGATPGAPSFIDLTGAQYPGVSNRVTTVGTMGDSIVRGEKPSLRRLLVESGTASLDQTVYLYHHFAATGFDAGLRVIAVPYGDGRLACYGVGTFAGTWPAHLGRMHDGCAAVVKLHDDASVVKVGTWPTTAEARVWGDDYARGGTSAAVGATITATVTGSRVGITGVGLSNGGTAIVSLDGSETAANLLPAVTQADIDAGLFLQAELGKRYINFYKAGTGQYDWHWAFADDLPYGDHVLSLRTTGLKPAASSDTRVMVSAFWGGGPDTKPTDAGARIVFVRDVNNPREGFSSTVSVVNYAPGAAPPAEDFELLSESHTAGTVTETVTSEKWYIDGVETTTAAGSPAYSASEIRYDRTTTVGHPDAAGCATKRVVHTFRADAPLQLTARGYWRWNVAGKVRSAFFGMLPLCQRASGLVQTEFNRATFLNGDAPAPMTIPTLNDQSSIYSDRGDAVAVYSTAHDTVALVHNPRMDLLNNQTLARTYLTDRTDGLDKAYIGRIDTVGGLPQQEAVVAGDIWPFECGWRIFRVPDAAARLAE